MDWMRLAEVLSEARKLAQAEKRNDASDGGSCNLDFVYVTASGIREATAAKYGYRIMRSGWHGRIMRVYSGEGQADLNARMVQAAYKVLAAAGFVCGVYYQLD